jgi:hypothetical protein
LPLKVLYAASTEEDSDLHARQPGAQNQSARGCESKTFALSNIAPLNRVAVKIAGDDDVCVAGVDCVDSVVSVTCPEVSAGSVWFAESAPQPKTVRIKTDANICPLSINDLFTLTRVTHLGRNNLRSPVA